MINAVSEDLVLTGTGRGGFERPSAVESDIRDVGALRPGADVAVHRDPGTVTSDAVAGSEFLDDRIRLLE